MMLGQREVKVVLLGDSGVGKSSILMRFCQNEFKDGNGPTLGAAFQSKVCIVQDQSFKFQIWDTAGQEKYKSLTPLYYRDAQVAVIVYDISNKESFEVLKGWVEELQKQGPRNLMQVLVANKSDLIEQEQVSYDEARQYANNIGAILKLISCKENKGVSELFQTIGSQIIEKESKAPTEVEQRSKSEGGAKLTSQNTKEKNKKNGGGCC